MTGGLLNSSNRTLIKIKKRKQFVKVDRFKNKIVSSSRGFTCWPSTRALPWTHLMGEVYSTPDPQLNWTLPHQWALPIVQNPKNVVVPNICYFDLFVVVWQMTNLPRFLQISRYENKSVVIKSNQTLIISCCVTPLLCN